LSRIDRRFVATKCLSTSIFIASDRKSGLAAFRTRMREILSRFLGFSGVCEAENFAPGDSLVSPNGPGASWNLGGDGNPSGRAADLRPTSEKLSRCRAFPPECSLSKSCPPEQAPNHVAP